MTYEQVFLDFVVYVTNLVRLIPKTVPVVKRDYVNMVLVLRQQCSDGFLCWE
jgi:hypothetical protein